MAFIFNHTNQTINASDNSKEIELISSESLQIPVASNITPLVNEYRNTAIMLSSPISGPLVLIDDDGTQERIDTNGRLHFHDSNNWSCVSEESDISLVQSHIDNRIAQENALLDARLDKLEAVDLLPPGCIFAWSGILGEIPKDFHLCNGQTYNGVSSPDMRDRFIVCTGGTPSTGGSWTHTLSDAELPDHKHVAPWGEHWRRGAGWGYYGSANNYGGNGGDDWDNHWPYSSPTGGSNTHNNTPPFYTLAYVMYAPA